MPDEPITDAAPLSMRPRLEEKAVRPPEGVVHAAHASLRATEAYVRVLIDRIVLAETCDLVRLDEVPADALVRLTAVSDALQEGAERVLRHHDPRLAQQMRAVADLAHQGALPDPTR